MATKEILAIGCHPDDAEEFVGGTLLLLKQVGYSVTLAVMTQGESGSRTVPAAEIIRIRDQEARAAADILGARYVNLGFTDERVFEDDRSTQELVRLIRDVDPAAIFTHPHTLDYMADHKNTGRLVLAAGPAAKHSNYEAGTSSLPIDQLPYLYHWDMQNLVDEGRQFAPVTTVVLINEVINQKIAAMACHISQSGGTAHRQLTEDLGTKVRAYAFIRGMQATQRFANVYGEGFNQQLMAGYPGDNFLGRALGLDRVFSLH